MSIILSSNSSQGCLRLVNKMLVVGILILLAHGCGGVPASQSTDDTGNSGVDSAGAGDAGGSGTNGVQEDDVVSQAVVNLVMHIESTQSPDIDNLISAIDELGAAGIPLSLGADMGWINAQPRADEVFSHVMQWEGALDVHYHYSAGYNRADLASKISVLGYSPTHVVSGYTPSEVAALQDVITPQLPFGSSWQPNYLWGESEPGHTSEDTSWGITLSETGGPLVIGNGQHTIASAQAMIDVVSANTYPGYLLTSAIMLDPITLTVVDESTNGVSQIMDFKNTADGQLASWLTLQATGELAESNYPGLDSRVESDKP